MYVVGGSVPRVKSSKTSGPLTVSSQVTQACHAVVPPGDPSPVGQLTIGRIGGVVERAIGEVLRQPEPHQPVALVGDRAQVAEIRAAALCLHRQCEKSGKGPAKGGATGGDGRGSKHGSAIDRGHVCAS